MNCNKCGAELPENSLFCFRCGNKLEQAPSKPEEKKSSSPFGTKTISDRHYSLEDIARQQREKEAETGFDLSEAPRRKKKKRQDSEESQLPSIGSSDKMSIDALGLLSAGQESAPAQQEQQENVPQSEPQTQPVQPEYSQPAVQQTQPQYSQPAVQQTQPQYSQPAAQQQEPTQSEPVISASQAAPSEAQPAQIRTPAPQKAAATFRYTIASPPAPLGLQRQTKLDLFGGNISAQIEDLRRSYIEKKNGG